MLNTFTGIPVSDGIAIAKVYKLQEPTFSKLSKKVINTEAEISSLESSLAKAIVDITAIQADTANRLGIEEAEVFSAHILLLSDPEFIGPIKTKIESEFISAPVAIQLVSEELVTLFQAMDNDYMRERAADIRDVSQRVLKHLLGFSTNTLQEINHEVILVTNDLTPSDTAQLNTTYIKGFVTAQGGRTSHSAIFARSLEIPAVVGVTNILDQLKSDDIVIIDGHTGSVIIHPDEETLTLYEEKKSDLERLKGSYEQLKEEASVTADGKQIEISSNIGGVDDLVQVLKNGAEGIGLFRTEFLFLERTTMPTEEEQVEAYRTVLEKMNNRPVVVRTLDIGGDKEVPYLNLPKEENPFLGNRAIRLCLSESKLFRTQLRSLLRASVSGNLKIMFPMIATMEELIEAKAILQEEKEKLLAENIAVSSSIEVGIMIEIPAAAIMADLLAKEVDFFSIGTNDLIQYTLAADRMNTTVSHLYQPLHPAVIRLIRQVIEAAHAEGKWVGMCGEMAGEELAVPLLLALGLDEFSMNASSILKVRAQVKKLHVEKLQLLLPTIFACKSAEEVAKVLENYIYV